MRPLIIITDSPDGSDKPYDALRLARALAQQTDEPVHVVLLGDAALVLLGVGWNFQFVASTALLARHHTAAERGKVQGLNDLVVFTAVAASALLAGALLHATSWTLLTLAILPILAATAAVILTWRLRHRHTEPAVAVSD